MGIVVVLASVGGLVWAKAALASSGAAGIPLGDYAGWVDPSGIAQFGATTGTHPTLATDYLDRTDGWSQMDSASGMGGWAGSGDRLVLGVPIIPGSSGATLAQGATGAYNQYFTTLAQNLVSEGLSNAILRLGWEFNGTWYPWSVASNTDAQNFAAYWQQIVDTMRAVPGEQFAFLWNPNLGGSSSWDLTQAYPGSAYVDYIGSDVYDEYWGTPQTPQNAWSNTLSQDWGLDWLSSFAASEGRPIAIPEWSVCIRSDGHGLGDDPYFINQFSSWLVANNAAFDDIFSFNDTAGGQDNDITDGNFPNSLAAFQQDFGGGSATLPTTTTTTAAPTTTTTVAPTTTTTRPPTTTTTVAPTTTTTRPPTTTTTRPPTTTTTAPSPAPSSSSGAPSAPTGLTAAVSGSTVTLSWSNPAGTLGDDVFRDGSEVAWPGWPSQVVSTYQDAGVATGTHTYVVSAYNSSGVGPSSSTVTVSTPESTPRTPAPTPAPSPTPTPGRNRGGHGYLLVGSDGGVFAFGDAAFHGSTGATSLAKPIVSMAATSDGAGYWLVGSDGGVFAFGDAGYHGSTGAMTLSHAIVGIAPTPDGGGYWLVGSDGGVFAFGDAFYYGSTGAMTLSHPIVGMAVTPDGKGYWLVGSDGGVFAFGDALYDGSTGGSHLSKPIVAIAATPGGQGYWLVGSDGGVFAYGAAGFDGSTGAIALSKPIVSMTPTPDGDGYWLVGSDGGVFAFGDAAFYGSTGAMHLARPVVASVDPV